MYFIHYSCYIGNTAVFFGFFLGPLLAIVLFNCVMFVIVFNVILKQNYKLMQRTKKSRVNHGIVFRLLIGVVGVMFLFGLTWIFGALTVSETSGAFQIIFLIFNAFQGFFIFLFLCVFNKDAREGWKNIMLKVCCRNHHFRRTKKPNRMHFPIESNLSSGTAGSNKLSGSTQESNVECMSMLRSHDASYNSESSEVIVNPAAMTVNYSNEVTNTSGNLQLYHHWSQQSTFYEGNNQTETFEMYFVADN